jgi:bacterial/archaeal transporter family-2 protein
MQVFFYLLALLCGLGMSVQAGVNAELRRSIQNPIFAAIVSFSVGLVSLCLVYPFLSKSTIPTGAALRALSWWQWTGGMLGSFFVTSVILTAPKIGSGNMTALIIAGQLLMAMTLDHWGWLGFQPHPINGWRLMGTLLMLLGVYLVVKN